MLGATISKARREFGGKGYVELEDFIEWVEKHSSHLNYQRWVKTIENKEIYGDTKSNAPSVA